jgi:cellulose synthase/poly-beta-1,6-N-acetylglucosamine synthase-like glycosyltransferase
MNRNRSTIPHSAARPLSLGQYALLTVVAALFGTQLAIFGLSTVLTTFIGCVTVFYVFFVGLKVAISLAAARSQEWIDRLNSLRPLSDDELGTYAVLVPAYGESREVLRRLANSLNELDYPRDKVTFFFLMEEKDPDTVAAFHSLGLPDHFVGIVTPAIGPSTKPKACNWAFQHYVSGNGFDHLVIFDAEDRPDTQQLRKAATAFAHLQRLSMYTVVCLQAELAFWNARSSKTSTFYWGEYSVHFNTVLRGLAQLGFIPPLGGTSNHFQVLALENVTRYNGVRTLYAMDDTAYEVTGPWDENNVTEDADLAMRLARRGYEVKMLNSTTYEEAPNKLTVSLKQRTRWLLGFAQTFFAWLQKPMKTVHEVGFIRWATYELLVGGTPLSLFLNPITWGATLTYIAARLAGATEIVTYMEGLFPGPIYYLGMFVAVGGNLYLWVQKLMVPVRRQELSESTPADQYANKYAANLAQMEYGLTARLFLTPLWWAFTSIPAWRAVWQFIKLLITGKFKWEKTQHGHDMANEDQLEGTAQQKQLTTGTVPSSADTLYTTQLDGEIEHN